MLTWKRNFKKKKKLLKRVGFEKSGRKGGSVDAEVRR